MEIIVTPKKEPVTINKVTGEKIKLKVAAYARVSTDLEDQKNSFEFQKEEFETRIKNNPEWEFVRMYSDKGISGTSTKNRKEFLQMIADSKAGKINLILTKSISRFARNTVDFLSTVRKLTEIGVSVYFEKENITTNRDNVDLVLTLYASLAESESRTISENVKWGIRKRMSKNEKKIPVGKTIGYDYNKDGTWSVNSDAPLIENIFKYFLEGFTYRQIASLISEQDENKERKWTPDKIHHILKNERYKGFIIHQKTVIIDVLTHKQVINDGIEPKYTVVGHHQAIVDESIFDYVQLILSNKSNQTYQEYHSNYNDLASLVYCENCGRSLRRIKYAYNNEFYLTCKNRTKSVENYVECDSNVVSYSFLKALSIEVIKKYKHLTDNDSSFALSLIEELSVYDFSNQANEIKKKITDLDLEINNLVQNQVKSETTDGYQDQFRNLKNKRKNLINKLNEISELAKETYDLHRKTKQISMFLKNDEESLLLEMRDVILRIIHRKNGSFRFAIKGNNYKQIPNEKLNEIILNLKPIFQDTFKSNENKENYDIVILEGGSND